MKTTKRLFFSLLFMFVAVAGFAETLTLVSYRSI